MAVKGEEGERGGEGKEPTEIYVNYLLWTCFIAPGLVINNLELQRGSF